MTRPILTKDQALSGLMAIRFGLGVAGWFAPKLVGRAMLINVEANPVLPWLMRLFAARDALMGVLVQAAQGRERDRQLRLGIAVDLIDVTASAVTGLARQLSPSGTVLCVGAGPVGASLGAAALGSGPLGGNPGGGRRFLAAGNS